MTRAPEFLPERRGMRYTIVMQSLCELGRSPFPPQIRLIITETQIKNNSLSEDFSFLNLLS